MKRHEKNYKKIKSLLKYARAQLAQNGKEEKLFTKDMLETLEYAKMCIGALPQIRWERDIAIKQLNELGYSLGEKIKKE